MIIFAHGARWIPGLAGLLCLALVGPARSQDAGGASPGESIDAWTTEQDHRTMMEQLGIRALRPGANGWAAAGEPGAANYDPARANPYPELPDPLVLESGRRIAAAEEWWTLRRPEIVEVFEREVYGRVPADVPGVTWEVVRQTDDGVLGGVPVVAKQLIGHVDNTAYPAIRVGIEMTLVVPADAAGPVPVLMMFGRRGLELPGPDTSEVAEDGPGPSRVPTRAMARLIAAGWGYAAINPNSIQVDNGAGLRSGIIGLVNRGRPRKPDDWGALRAWAWGAARGLDYLETDAAVDARRVGIEGVSRYGKAALVAHAFEPRFAVALVGSSGKGGTTLHRRRFGEAVENLTGAGEYHWMAGNYLKYGTETSTFGRMDAGDLPVDSHELLALCAPRPVFVSYGIPERGDAHWLDHQGSFMAAVAAGPVYRLLGARDLGIDEDYRTVGMPPVNTGLLKGELAWRQHDGGHETQPNIPYFIAWAERVLKPASTPAN